MPESNCAQISSSSIWHPRELKAASGFDWIELAALDKEIEEVGMRFETAVSDPLDQLLQLSALCARQQRDARAFNGRIAHL